MKMPLLIERLVYALVIALAIAALWLVFNAPANFMQARVVYQGF